MYAFIGGPHGAGKTTLLRRLQREDLLFPDLETVAPKFHTSPLERITLKLCERAIESYETREIAKSNPEMIVIGNRCIYDADAYADAYAQLGWITPAECEQLLALARNVFPQDMHNPYAIILNPPVEVVKEHLRSRWSEGERKWNEEDFSYLAAACDAYKMFEGNERVLYLTKNDCVEQVSNWLGSIFLP